MPVYESFTERLKFLYFRKHKIVINRKSCHNFPLDFNLLLNSVEP